MKINMSKLFYLCALMLMLPVKAFCSVESSVDKSVVDTTSSIGSDPMSSGYLLQLIIGLIVVVICILALAWVAKRVNGLQSSTDGMLKILGGISMGSRERVVLLQVGEKQLLLGVSPGRINTLHVLDGNIENENLNSDSIPGGSFSEKLKDKLAKISNTQTQKSGMNDE